MWKGNYNPKTEYKTKWEPPANANAQLGGLMHDAVSILALYAKKGITKKEIETELVYWLAKLKDIVDNQKDAPLMSKEDHELAKERGKEHFKKIYPQEYLENQREDDINAELSIEVERQKEEGNGQK